MVEFLFFTHYVKPTIGHTLLYQLKIKKKKRETYGVHAVEQPDIDQDGNEHLGQCAERRNGAPRQAPLSKLSSL